MDPRLKLTIPKEDIEEAAWKQIEAALALPCLEKLAIMPDVHAGYDLPIGAVALLKDHIWPGAVGYDIGCGMCHINTGRTQDELLADPRDIFTKIVNEIPTGFVEHGVPRMPFDDFYRGRRGDPFAQAVVAKAEKQIGTLGGGNHFIEIGVNSQGLVGITIHSGSRRPGWLIGDYYMRLTKGPVYIGSKIGQEYVKDMNWALGWALFNRASMMTVVLRVLGLAGQDLLDTMINENHNHAEVIPGVGILHRKGATPAEAGQLGIIPANMRDGVWITRGLGNEEFLRSASHGAGRAMGRKAAQKVVDPGRFETEMRDIITPDLCGLVDEAPYAYKNIQQVIAAQEGRLVEIVDHFRPIIVVKG